MTEKNPWQILASKKIYENPWVRIDEHDVVQPKGGKGIYSVVHFQNLAIAVLPLDENYNTWIVGQWRFPVDEFSWEIPEGGGDPNVDPIESARRELQEEAGIIAGEFIKIQEVHLSNSATDELGIIYIARNLSFTTSSPEETEELQLKKIPFEKLYQMVMDGKIKDGLTIMAVMKTKLLMQQGKL